MQTGVKKRTRLYVQSKTIAGKTNEEDEQKIKQASVASEIEY